MDDWKDNEERDLTGLMISIYPERKDRVVGMVAHLLVGVQLGKLEFRNYEIKNSTLQLDITSFVGGAGQLDI